MWCTYSSSVDKLVRILEAGIDVVATAAFITGANLGAERDERGRLRKGPRCSARASARASRSWWPSRSRDPTESTGSPSRRPPTPRSTTRPTPSARPASAWRSTPPTWPAAPATARPCSARRWRWLPTLGVEARRDHVRRGVHADHRGPGDGVVDDPRRPRRRGRRQLAGQGRRQDAGGEQRAVEEGRGVSDRPG